MTSNRTVFDRQRVTRFGVLALAVTSALVVGACSGDDSPTSSSSTNPVLTSAVLSVNGQVVNGMTVPQGHGQGSSTRFEATMTDMQGRPATGMSMQVQYQRPQGMGMMNPNGTMMLYDDGTHGDPMPNDGTYCYEDWTGDYGCHTQDSPMGQYHYEFWGMDAAGHQSNHMAVDVTVGS